MKVREDTTVSAESAVSPMAAYSATLAAVVAALPDEAPAAMLIAARPVSAYDASCIPDHLS